MTVLLIIGLACASVAISVLLLAIGSMYKDMEGY